MKTLSSLLIAVALAANECPAIEAVLKADIFAPVNNPSKKLIPDAPRLRVGNGNVTLLMFDPHVVVPEGTTADNIAKAVLKVWVNRTKDFSPGGIEVYGVNSRWEERDVIPYWVPGFTPGSKIAFAAVHRSGCYVTFDVTSAVKGWFGGQTNLGFLLTIYPGKYRAVPYIRLGPGDPGFEESTVHTDLNAWLDSKESKGNEATLQLVLIPNK